MVLTEKISRRISLKQITSKGTSDGGDDGAEYGGGQRDYAVCIQVAEHCWLERHTLWLSPSFTSINRASRCSVEKGFGAKLCNVQIFRQNTVVIPFPPARGLPAFMARRNDNTRRGTAL
jgi:hypothetical protein